MARTSTNDPTVSEMTQTLLCVRVPAANLRKEPIEADALARDNLQESQLLTNELFRPLREEQDWYYGEAVEQPYHTEKGWSGYPGWVKKSDLMNAQPAERPNAVVVSLQGGAIFSAPDCRGRPLITLPLGSRVWAEPQGDNDSPSYKVHLRSGRTGWAPRDTLRVLSQDTTDFVTDARIDEVVQNAFLFQGVPYFWGGMTAYPAAVINGCSQVAWGVDCSALVCLSYRLSGINIPRNACHQWIITQPREHDKVRSGDLVFISREDSPETMRHVMICTGPESMIEASETGRTVSQTTFAEKFGLSYYELRQAEFLTEGRRLYFGRIMKGLEEAVSNLESHQATRR